MGFAVPTMPVPVDLWRFGTPVGNPADLSFSANLSFRKDGRPFVAIQGGGSVSYLTAVELLCPKLTDIRGHTAAPFNGDRVEVPAGSGRFYAVIFVEDVGKTFANEYRLAILAQLTSLVIGYTGQPWGPLLWPVPTP
jgi:hypothetical protein